MLVDNTLDILGKQIAEKINTSTSTFQDSCTVPTNASPPNDLLISASLKKKDVQTKSSKQKRTWLDKKHKATKKRENKLHLSLVKRVIMMLYMDKRQLVVEHKHKGIVSIVS
jgi:hypothetical protein